MLLSFNKCSISALTAPIYQSVEKNATRRKLENLTSTSIIYRFVCIQYHVILSNWILCVLQKVAYMSQGLIRILIDS